MDAASADATASAAAASDAREPAGSAARAVRVGTGDGGDADTSGTAEEGQVRVCDNCGKSPAKLRCTGCKAVWYCRRKCQVAGWKAGHKAVCKKPESRTASATVTRAVTLVHVWGVGAARAATGPLLCAWIGHSPQSHMACPVFRVRRAVKTRTKKPHVDEFAIAATDIGAGNFSRVMRARHKKTNEVFALKQLEKVKIARLRKRHPNVNNEIMMEKRVLSKLNHPGIVRLYHTFQVQWPGRRAGPAWARSGSVVPVRHAQCSRKRRAACCATGPGPPVFLAGARGWGRAVEQSHGRRPSGAWRTLGGWGASPAVRV